MAPSPGPPVRTIATTAWGPHAPSFRVRVILPAEALAREGVVVRPLTALSLDEHAAFSSSAVRRRVAIVRGARRRVLGQLADGPESTLLVQQQADLFPSLEVERTAARGRRLIYDVDDAVWLAGSRNAGGHALSLLKGSRRKARWLARRAAHVIAGNVLLAEWLSSFNDQVTVVPSLVEPASIPVREHVDRDELVLGWIGSATTAPNLERVRAWAAKAVDALPGRRVKLVAVGGPAPELDGVETESLRWDREAELRALAEMDIGLMPLPDNPWTRGKCAYKAIQYMAAGVPVVADDVGVTADVIGNGEAGYVARGPGEWLDAVVELASDVERRARFGARGRQRVERDFSVERWAGRLAAIFRGHA